LVYFDECYDQPHTYLILGALFNPEHKKIHRDFLHRKRNKHFIRRDGSAREIKYSSCISKSHYDIACEAVNCFMDSQSSFRAIVIDQSPKSGFTFDFWGRPSESMAIKRAKAYKRFTELLLRSNISNVSDAVLRTDRMTRCRGDIFLRLIEELFGTAGMNYSLGKDKPIFRCVEVVDTALEQYHVGQIGDILQGVILNELVPISNEWKNKLREYTKKKLGLKSLSQDYWLPMPKWKQDQLHPKYQIWYWKPQEK